VLLADLLTVTAVPNLPRLGLRVLLTDVVLADQGRSAAVGCVTEVTFTAECAITLFDDVGVQRYHREAGQTGFFEFPLVTASWSLYRTRRRWEVLVPAEITACSIGSFQNIFQCNPGGVLCPEGIDAYSVALI